MCFGNDFTVSSHFAIWGCSLAWVKANFHWNRHGSGTAANRSPKIIETIKVNVGYSTGYGTGTARNRPQTGTSFTIPLLFLKVAGSLPCLRTRLQPISLPLCMNIHELTSIPMQFTGYCNIIQSI